MGHLSGIRNFGIGSISVPALSSGMHMKTTPVFVLTALAESWAIFHMNAPGNLTSQPEGEYVSAGVLRSFEIVPL